LHKTSTDIARSFGTVVIEDLNVKNMTASARGTREQPGRMVRQKAGLNRAILEQGWTAFAHLLTYKLEERGGDLVTDDPAYTSQTCSACGATDKRSRKSQAVFKCFECGYRVHADLNAAINILRRGNTPSLPVEALDRGPAKREPTAA
jgi:putative transposase